MASDFRLKDVVMEIVGNRPNYQTNITPVTPITFSLRMRLVKRKFTSQNKRFPEFSHTRAIPNQIKIITAIKV